MQTIRNLFVAAVLFCLCSSFYPTSQYVPILMLRGDMEKAIKLESPRPMYEPGKIYYKAPYLFIVEKYKGVHIIDNSNPASPENLNFLHIDGIRDVAVKGNVMYADNAVDLIAIQLNNSITEVSVTKRIENYFPEMTSPDGFGMNYSVWAKRPDNSIIVGWKKH